MWATDLEEQALVNCQELGAELARMERRYGETGSIDLDRYRSISQLEELAIATAAISHQLGAKDAGQIGGNGHAN